MDTGSSGVRSGFHGMRDNVIPYPVATVVEMDLDLVLDIEYEVVKNPKSCRLFPIDITGAKHRGKDIFGSLHIGHILTLQRRVYNRLIDSGEIEEPVNKVGL